MWRRAGWVGGRGGLNWLLLPSPLGQGSRKAFPTFIRCRSNSSNKSDQDATSDYQSTAQSVLDTLFAQSSPSQEKKSNSTSKNFTSSPSPRSGSSPAPGPDHDDLLGEMESLIAERRINESLVLYRKLHESKITLPEPLQANLVRLCESMAHRFEYAVKLHELKAQLGLPPPSPMTTSPPSDNPVEAFDMLLAESHRRFLQLAGEDPLQALAMFGELYDIQPKVDAQSFQSMVGNLSPLYLTKLKYAIRAKKPASSPDLTTRTKESRPSYTSSSPRKSLDEPLPVSSALPSSTKSKKPFFAPPKLNPEIVSLLESPEVAPGWDLLVKQLDDENVLHESLRYYTAARQVWDVSTTEGEATASSGFSQPTLEKSSAIAASHLRQLEKEEQANRVAKKKKYHAAKRLKASSDHSKTSRGKLKSVTRKVKSRRNKKKNSS